MEILFIFLAIVAFFVVSLIIWNTIQQKKGNCEKSDKVFDTSKDKTQLIINELHTSKLK